MIWQPTSYGLKANYKAYSTLDVIDLLVLKYVFQYESVLLCGDVYTSHGIPQHNYVLQ
jgi:hypothetical protein